MPPCCACEWTGPVRHESRSDPRMTEDTLWHLLRDPMSMARHACPSLTSPEFKSCLEVLANADPEFDAASS